MPVTIDLSHRPAPPQDFPHRCFELSLRTKAVFAVLKGPQPWGADSATSAARQHAYDHLQGLADEIHALFAHHADDTTPFTAALRSVLVPGAARHAEDHRHDLLTAGAFARERPDIPERIDESNLLALEALFMNYTQHLERLGLYFLRMLQVIGNNLPAQLVVKAQLAAHGWITVVEA
jgi:hypothetical protein